jgi:hypothetical protein
VHILLENPAHPSLRFKKLEGYADYYEISVTMSIRITMQLIGDTYHLRKIGPHDILRNP